MTLSYSSKRNTVTTAKSLINFKENPNNYRTSKTSHQTFSREWWKKSTVFQKVRYMYLSILNNSLVHNPIIKHLGFSPKLVATLRQSWLIDSIFLPVNVYLTTCRYFPHNASEKNDYLCAGRPGFENMAVWRVHQWLKRPDLLYSFILLFECTSQ